MYVVRSAYIAYLNLKIASFRDVLLVAKKLSKERDEMCRELGRLYESMMELHNNMTMEIQVLTKENNSLRRNTTMNTSQPNE